MHLEVESAANLVTHFLRLSKAIMHDEQLNTFNKQLVKYLTLKYSQNSNWKPERPFFRSRIRAISTFNCLPESELYKAANKSNIKLSLLLKALPKDLLIWVDPGKVSYRITNGPEYTIFTYLGPPIPWSPNSM